MESIKPNLSLEVYIQDAFFADKDEGSCPVNPETWQIWFQGWLENLSPELPPAQGYELTLRLTDDGEVQALNAQYRGKNRPTDVLAFAALEVDAPKIVAEDLLEPLYLGDLIISVDTALRQAAQQAHPLKTELAWLACHGFLHLLGWDHLDEESLREMLSQQQTLLKTIGIIVEINVE
jgi:probable rRNA maturation factor